MRNSNGKTHTRMTCSCVTREWLLRFT